MIGMTRSIDIQGINFMMNQYMALMRGVSRKLVFQK